jgi:quinol-cytochrome oxidoreductase complex cytochrome b subunit
VKSAAFRPLYKIFFWLFVVCAVLLGYMGSQPPEGIYVIAARFLTVYYFLHFFVILPLLGKYEKPKLLPASICDAVLGKSGKTEATDTDSLHAREPGQ